MHRGHGVGLLFRLAGAGAISRVSIPRMCSNAPAPSVHVAGRRDQFGGALSATVWLNDEPSRWRSGDLSVARPALLIVIGLVPFLARPRHHVMPVAGGKGNLGLSIERLVEADRRGSPR